MPTRQTASNPCSTARRKVSPPASPANASAAGIVTHPGWVTEPRWRSSTSRTCMHPPIARARRPGSRLSAPQRRRMRPGSVSRPASMLATPSSTISAIASRSACATGLDRISETSPSVSVCAAPGSTAAARAAAVLTRCRPAAGSPGNAPRRRGRAACARSRRECCASPSRRGRAGRRSRSAGPCPSAGSRSTSRAGSRP